MKSSFDRQSRPASVALSGITILAAAFLPACLWHPNRNRDLGVAVTPNSQPDKMLFQKAQNEIDHGRYDVGRLTLQVLINTYPDSEYLAKAKLLTADSYYRQGGISGLTQSEAEYLDFITFFPTAPEAPMAQYRAGMAHFKLMGKADRDLTEARAAEVEFKTFLEKYPDNSMVPAVKGRLREVQEVIAEGDYETALLYYRKGVHRAALSRFQEIADNYPSFSQADEALWYLGQSQEKLHKANDAAAAYDRLLSYYPLSIEAKSAKLRLTAMHQPIPKASKATLARARADRAVAKQDKRSLMARLEGDFSSAPDLSATRHGPVRLGEHAGATQQTEAQKGAAGTGAIAVQPLSDSESKGQAPAAAAPDNSGSSSTSPDSNNKGADTPSSTTGSAPVTQPAQPASGATATSVQPGASTTPPGSSKADPATSKKSDQPAQTAKSDQSGSASKSDPPKKGKFHFLKKLIP